MPQPEQTIHLYNDARLRHTFERLLLYVMHQEDPSRSSTEQKMLEHVRQTYEPIHDTVMMYAFTQTEAEVLLNALGKLGQSRYAYDDKNTAHIAKHAYLQLAHALGQTVPNEDWLRDDYAPALVSVNVPAAIRAETLKPLQNLLGYPFALDSIRASHGLVFELRNLLDDMMAYPADAPLHVFETTATEMARLCRQFAHWQRLQHGDAPEGLYRLAECFEEVTL